MTSKLSSLSSNGTLISKPLLQEYKQSCTVGGQTPRAPVTWLPAEHVNKLKKKFVSPTIFLSTPNLTYHHESFCGF